MSLVHPAQVSAAPRASASALFGRMDARVVLVAALLLAAGGWLAVQAGGARMALLWAIGAGLGLALYLSSFGFTAGYRGLIRSGASAQVRAQLLLLGLLVVLFYPALAAGSVFGLPVRGFVFPIGVELVIGAMLFGLGMQIANGCGSGTLFTVGGGSVRMVVVLAGFIAGATLAAFTFDLWSGAPRVAGVSLPQTLGTWPALVAQLAVLAVLWIGLAAYERRRTGAVAPLFPRGSFGLERWSHGAGAVVLALLCFATLVVAGRPWGITQAFALWGSWGVEASGFDEPGFWAFWEEPTRADLLHRAFWADAMSVMNVAIIVGALLAAGLAGRFNPAWRMGFGAFVSAILGGLLLGFGAIMATGCNVGAFISGVASGSLHGWVWIAAALAGTWVGVKVRPLFGLERAQS
jgi:uncharacterized membrane protein YedE/YeeE